MEEEHFNGGRGASGGGLRPQPPPGRFPGRAVPTSVRRAVSREAVSHRLAGTRTQDQSSAAAAAAVRPPEPPTTTDDMHGDIPAMVAGWGFAGPAAVECGPGTGGGRDDDRRARHLSHLNPLVQQQRSNPLLVDRGDPQHRVQVRMCTPSP